MNIPKIGLNFLGFGRVRPNAAFHAVTSYNSRMGKSDIQYLKNVRNFVLEQATNYRFDVDYFGQGYHVIDNRTNSVLGIDRHLNWLDEACAVAKFNNDRAMKADKNKNDGIDVIRQDIFNLTGFKFDK